MSKKSVVDSFSYPVDEVKVITALEKIAAREQRSKSHMILVAVKEYVRIHEGGNSQYTLDKAIERGFEAFPSLGEKNQREKLEKMSDPDVIDILRYSKAWSIEAEACLRRKGYRDTDIKHLLSKTT